MVAHGQRLLFVRRGGGERFTDCRCRGRRPRRPAEVSGDAKVHGRDESLPYGWNVSGRWPGSGGAKDQRAAMARLRAGHARPLRTATNGLRTGGAREGGSPPLCSWRVVARERVVTQSPSKPLRPRKLSQLPTAWGAFCAGEAREGSLPIRGGGREAGRKGSRACGWLPVNGLLR